MTLLKNGITGFYHSRSPQGILSVDFDYFKQQIGGVLSSVGYKPEEFTKQHASSNYYVCTFEHDNVKVGVLCNAVYPILAFVSPYADGIEFNFIELPSIKSAIENYTNFQVCSVEYLNSNLTKDDLTALNEAELLQINYWQPTSKGELLFNFWD